METPTPLQLLNTPAPTAVQLWALCPSCDRITRLCHGHTAPLCACSPHLPARPPRVFALGHPDKSFRTDP